MYIAYFYKMLKYTVLLLFLLSFNLKAQEKIKIKREDNSFLFYQMGIKSDTIKKNKQDMFYIHLPDSAKHNISIFVNNGYFKPTNTTNQYQLVFINGMKYSHTKPDSIFNTLLEGHCTSQKIIYVKITNTKTEQELIKSVFYCK